uniref:hypothetical protein n=1 Tax=Parerythrobacter aestuarii TaxID=3020909 RepID=UPI0024DE7B92
VEAVTVDGNGVLGTTAVASAAAVRDVQAGLGYLAAVSDQQFSALSGRVSGLEAGLADLSFQLQDLDKGLSGGIAAAMAMGNAPIIPGKNISLWFNAATYGGEQGFSGSISGKISDGMYVSAGITGNTGDDEWGARVGVGFGF